MRNLNIYVGDNEKVVHLIEPIVDPRTITLKHATVFWRYENVTTKNNAIVYDGRDITLTPGYWDFEAIRERLGSENIILSRNIPDRTCNVLSKGGSVDLKNLGVMLGFEKNKVIAADTQTKSQGPVDVLHGLRYINVMCDAVDIRGSTGTDGNRSMILSSLPIVSYEALNSSATNYFNINNAVSMCSGDITRLKFTVSSNIGGPPVGADVLLSIVVE